MNANQPAARLAQAIDPASCPIDGRDSRDRLAFVAELSRLILYYDAQNRLAGDWQPFFLKDPAILLAAIGKTDYKSSHVQFVQLDQRFPAADDGARIALINDLCRLLRGLFVILNRWQHFLQRGGREHPLRAFLKKKIETGLSAQLWTAAACQQYLSIQTGGKVERPDTYQDFEQVWRSQDKPGWRPEGEPLAAGWTSLAGVYHAVFDVFVQAVEQATTQFYTQVSSPTSFPDTALLIAFCGLMDQQRALVNDYGRQHLDFYYGRVLQQEPLPAQPDDVFVFLSLKAAAEALSLPEGAEFTAGTYPDNSDIVFASDARVDINRITVASASALYYQSGGGLYLTDVATPSVPVPGRQWPAYGDASGAPVRQGFALASPMLLLQGGLRDITIALEFEGTPPAGLFDGASCCLSIGKAWLEVPVTSLALEPNSIRISLLASDPPIVAPAQPLDGLQSEWPMFRLLLGPSSNLLQPPSLRGVQITTKVTGLGQLALANDVSPLPDAGPAQMFGPIPELGNCFYIGSREVFAKRLQTLGLTIQWDNLPVDFADYYADYNSYLATRPQAPVPPLQTFDNTAFRGQWSLLAGHAWQPFDPAEPPPATDTPLAPSCLFQQPTPAPTPAPAPGSTPAPTPAPVRPPNLPTSTFAFAAAEGSLNPPAPALAASPLLPPLQADAGYLRFSLLAPAWAFGNELYPKLVSHISLLNAQALIDMAKEPSLISKIVAAIKNFVAGVVAAVKKVVDKIKSVLKKIGDWIKKIFGKPVEEDKVDPTPAPTPAPPVLIEMPNLPYSPRQAGVSLDYAANCASAIPPATAPDDGQPLQLWHIGPFQSYLAYEAGVAGGQGFAACVPGVAADGGLPLFPGAAGQGMLYLGLDGVTGACTLSLFIEVCRSGAAGTPAWFGWGASGWQAVTVVDDGTDGLRRSGIVRLCLPAPVACPVMPAKRYWLALVGANAGVTFGYVQTQAVRLRRQDVSMFAPGQVPVIAANAITGMRNPPAGLGAIVQPFPSAGGLPAETQDSFSGSSSFYRRVSARLNTKDRCSSLRNYADMAYEACGELYFARALPGDDGQVMVGLVPRYASAAAPNAWRPVMDADALDSVQQYIAQRVSAMALPCAVDFDHEEVQVSATLVVTPDASQATLLAELNQSLQLYLSPWIDSELPQMDVSLGLTSSGVIAVLRSHPQVLSIAAFSLLDAQGMPLRPGPDGLLAPSPGAIFITAMEHALTVATSTPAPAPTAAPAGIDEASSAEVAA